MEWNNVLGDQYVIESDGLLIKGVTKKNAGTFTCRARVPQTGELEERDIRLDVRINFQLFDIITFTTLDVFAGTRASKLDHKTVWSPWGGTQ